MLVQVYNTAKVMIEYVFEISIVITINTWIFLICMYALKRRSTKYLSPCVCDNNMAFHGMELDGLFRSVFISYKAKGTTYNT